MIALMLFVVICLVFLSSLVVSQGLDKAPNRAMLTLAFFLGTWILMVFGLQAVFGLETEYRYQLAYSRAVFAVGGLSLFSLAWFVIALLSLSDQFREALRKALIIAGALLLLLCMSPYVIVDVASDLSGAMPLPYYGALIPVYIGVVVVMLMAISSMVIWGSVREKKARRRQQVRVVGAAISFAIVAGIVTNLVVPWLTGSAQSSLFMTIPILIMMTGLCYAIIRHGLLDIKLAAVRSVAYVFSLATLAGLYYLSAYVASQVLFKNEAALESVVSPINIILALVLAFLFQSIKQFFDRVTDSVFYRNRYDTNDFLIRIGRILTSTTELQEILRKVSQEIRSTLKASGSLFIVYRDNHPNELVGENIAGQFSEVELSELNAASAQGGLMIVSQLGGDSKRQSLYKILSKKRIALVLPLISADEVIGYLMLGEHKVGAYTKQDIEALEAMANELVIAVQNARAVQAIRDLNAHLEQRISEATKELRKNNAELKQADEAKDEFVSMASHQLRTPLTSIKGYISMVLEGDAGSISPMQKKLLEEAFTSSERMVHLIGDFLNVSRLQTGKFMLDRSLVNLADLVEEEVEGLTATAEARALKLKYRKPTLFPSLYIDGGKINQVIMNFIDNAIYYSAENTSIAIRLAVEDGDAVFEVRDTGIGVPKSEQARLFTKFFRATNARRQRPDGTGIGLYLAKKVITAHGGSMVFRSAEGEGSAFGFRLPIKKLSEVPDELAAAVEVDS